MPSWPKNPWEQTNDRSQSLLLLSPLPADIHMSMTMLWESLKWIRGKLNGLKRGLNWNSKMSLKNQQALVLSGGFGINLAKKNSIFLPFLPDFNPSARGLVLPALKWEGHQKGPREKNNSQEKNLADPENTTWIFYAHLLQI